MRGRCPYLLITSPSGGDRRVDLQAERITVGRAAPGVRPDVVLEPDPQQWVGRVHCLFDVVEGFWAVSDNATVNGTFLRRDGAVHKIAGQVRLLHGDAVLILGDLDEGAARYWQLRLVDPFTTQPAPADLATPVPGGAQAPAVEYDWVEARMFRIVDGRRDEVTALPPKAHQLVRYMLDQNRRNDGAAVVCTLEELRRALWGDPDEWPAHRGYTDQDVRDVVYQARQRIETRTGTPQFLQTVRGLGYRLHSRAAAGGAG